MQDVRHVEHSRPETVRAEDLTPSQRRRIVYGRLRQEAAWRRAVTPHGYQDAQPLVLSSTQMDSRRDFRNATHVPDEERFPHEEEKKTRKALLQARGIKVRTKVMLSYWEADNPSLQIETQRLNDRGNTFWVSDRTAYGFRNPYHITVGYLSKIKAEVPNWQRHLKALIRKFHEQTVTLRISGFSGGGNAYLDEFDDAIASDPDFRALHYPHRIARMTQKELQNLKFDYPHVTQ